MESKSKNDGDLSVSQPAGARSGRRSGDPSPGIPTESNVLWDGGPLSHRIERPSGEFLVEGGYDYTIASVSEPVLGHRQAGIDESSSVDADQPGIAGSAGPEGNPGSLIDFRLFANYLSFLLDSVRRHWKLGTAVWITTVVAIGVLAVVLPKTYHVQVKLLAQRNEVMAALSNPGRAIPWDADAPTRAAAETVHRNDNLVSLIKQTNLMERWNRTRVPILRLKDALSALILGDRRTESEKLEAMVLLLESRLVVTTGSALEGTVTIGVDWPDPQMAYELVEAAQQAFLDARQLAETSAISESISILESYSTTLHQQMSQTVAELQQAQAQRTSASRAPAKLSTVRVPAVPPPPPPVESILGALQLGAGLGAVPGAGPDSDPELDRLKTALTAKRQEIKSLEELRQRQITDLQNRLAQLRLVYTDNHPSVLDAQQNLTSLSRQSPQLLALRAEEQGLLAESEKRQAAALLQEDENRAEDARRLAQAPPLSAGGAQGQASRKREAEASPPATEERRGAPRDETATDYPTLRFRLQLSQLQSVLDRIDGARIELAVSQAAFKYRYTVIRPARVPREPVKPNVRAIFAAGLVGALGLALMATVAVDLRSQRILHTWQLDRQLGLPALGVMRTP